MTNFVAGWMGQQRWREEHRRGQERRQRLQDIDDGGTGDPALSVVWSVR